MNFFQKKVKLPVMCLVLSLYTLIAFHIPFFRHVLNNTSGGFNGVWIFGCLVLLMLTLNFFFYYIVLYAGRFVGKCIIAFTLLGNATMLYFVNIYHVLVTDKMMGNVLHTQYSEASGFFSWTFLLYLLLLGILPCVYLFWRKIEYGSWKQVLACTGIPLAVVIGIAFGNMKNWPWIDRNAPVLGSLLMPWSYVVNTFRYYSGERKRNVKEIPLPDVTSVSDSRDVCVLIIGESARRDHFSLYGYPRETNPYTAADSVTAIPAVASATYTIAGVKAILEATDTKALYEILPNYLQRAGADVFWRTSNWGEPPVHTENYFKVSRLKERFPGADDRYDSILLEGLRDDIEGSEKAKVFVVLHTNTNHGPAYYSKYPEEFEVFKPACKTVEMSQTSQAELFNAYDNSILYTDWLIHSVISTLREIPDRRSCVIFVSDHGESLGENNLYMHGVPMAMAPKEQIEIPFIVWTSDHTPIAKPTEEIGQHHVFHSVLSFLGIESPVLDREHSIFDR